MLKYIPSALVLMLVSRTAAQSQFVPQNARSVFCANLAALSKKMDVKSLKNYSFLTRDTQNAKDDPANALFFSYISDPQANGVDLSSKIFQFSSSTDTLLENLSLEYYFGSGATQYYIVPVKDYGKAQAKLKQVMTDLSKYMRRDESRYAKFERDMKSAETAMSEAIDTIAVPSLGAVVKPRPAVPDLSYDPLFCSVFTNYSKKNSSVSIPERGFSAVLEKNVLVICRTRTLNIYPKNYKYYDHEMDSVKAIVDSIRFLKIREQENNIDRAINEDEAITDSLEVVMPPELLYDNQPYYDYYSDPKILEFIRWRIARDSAIWVKKNLEASELYIRSCRGILTIPANKNLAAVNANFRDKLSEPNDVFYFMNLESIWLEQYLNDYAELIERLEPEQRNKLQLLKYVKNAYTEYDGNFEKGRLNFTSNLNPGDSLKEIMSNASGEYLNYNLLNAIPIDKPMGIMALTSDVNKGIEWYFKMLEVSSKDALYLQSLKNSDRYYRVWRDRTYGTVLNIAYNMIDPKLLYGTLDGGMMMAITGTREYTEEYQSYQMDEEGNYGNITKTQQRQVPTFVLASMCNNNEVVKRVMEPFLKFGFATFTDSGYVLKLDRQSDLSFKLILKDGMIVFTNDLRLINHKPNFDKLIVTGDIATNFNKKTMYCRIDNNSVIENLQFLGFWGFDFNKTFEKMISSAVVMEMWSLEKTTQSQGYISFKNKEKNSLIEIFDIAEMMFKD